MISPYKISPFGSAIFWLSIYCVWKFHCRNTLLEKCSNTEFFLVCIFSHWNWIRRDTEYLSVFSANTEKQGPEKTSYLDTFHAEMIIRLKDEVISYFKYSSIAIDQYCSGFLWGPFNKYVTWEGRRRRQKSDKNGIGISTCSQKSDASHTNSSVYSFSFNSIFPSSFFSWRSDNITARNKKNTSRSLSVYLI